MFGGWDNGGNCPQVERAERCGRGKGEGEQTIDQYRSYECVLLWWVVYAGIPLTLIGGIENTPDKHTHFGHQNRRKHLRA